jgi:hypothetical protein
LVRNTHEDGEVRDLVSNLTKHKKIFISYAIENDFFLLQQSVVAGLRHTSFQEGVTEISF